MLGYSGHTTPPFNSPYQHHTSKPSLLDSPYPSPNRVEPGSRYTGGLGLYNYQQHCLPPTPQSSPTWVNHSSSGASPLVSGALADPWTSGAFEHPVSHSPQSWSSAHTSPRSSLSSNTREMSVFSHASSDTTYTGAWTSACYDTKQASHIESMQFSSQQQLDAASNQLNAGGFSYGNGYGPSAMATIEPLSSVDYKDQEYEQPTPEGAVASPHLEARPRHPTTSVPRERSRNPRHTDPANAAFRCHICPEKGFARRYNYNQHMLTHEAYRKKDHVCPHTDCLKAFTRKTDLVRHNVSVHLQLKEFRCVKCPKDFSRKDTLRRHEEDGCSRRLQVHVGADQAFARL